MRFAFVGNKGHGKTTAAKYLVENYGFTRMSFADPVKDISVNMLNEMVAYLDGIDGFSHGRVNRELLESMKYSLPIRKLLQLVGTELGREYFGDKDIWVDAMQANLDSASGNIVIDDCRFLNEAKMLTDNDFTICRIVRPNLPESEDTHASEVEQRNIEECWTFYPESVEDLHYKLDWLVENSPDG